MLPADGRSRRYSTEIPVAWSGTFRIVSCKVRGRRPSCHTGGSGDVVSEGLLISSGAGSRVTEGVGDAFESTVVRAMARPVARRRRLRCGCMVLLLVFA